jgi:hypothetical protein
MFNDRDLGILGAGALLAVFCLVLPLPFAVKIILGLLVLVSFAILALLRLGPDRIPLEEWLRRRIRFRLRARRYTYQQPGFRQRRARPAPADRGAQPVRSPVFTPLTLSLDEVGVYPLVTVLLFVLGVYFLAWLTRGGAKEINLLLGGFFL